MRVLLSAFLLCFLALSPALASRVVEVQNIHVEQSGAGGRDAAVAEATRQAANQVWSQISPNTPVPALTPAELQAMASYVDVTNETVQPNYYAGNFNIGIIVGALKHGSASAETPQTTAPAQNAEAPAPSWVLIIPVREVGGVSSLWNINDEWARAWQRATASGFATASAGGDARDQIILPANQVSAGSNDMTTPLREFIDKYDAPAAAIVTLSSASAYLVPGANVTLDVVYLEKDQTEAMARSSTIYLNAPQQADLIPTAVKETQKLMASLIHGDVATAPSSPTPTPVQPVAAPAIGSIGQFSHTYSQAPAAPTNAQKLWVRIPLSTPMDLANYRRKIEDIPGAKFEITSLNRMYVEGNIVYSGPQAELMKQLAAHGLSQQ